MQTQVLVKQLMEMLILGLVNSDYDTCSYTITNGTASVTLKGKGKFAGYTCTGTRTGITGECKKSS